MNNQQTPTVQWQGIAAAVFATTLLMAPAMSQAGRPLATEDADILAENECEWEGFVARESSSGSPSVRGWATQVGCGLGVLSSQVALGYGRSRANSEPATQELAISGKTGLLERTDTQPLGITLAWAIGATRAQGRAFKHDATLLNLVATRAIGDDLKLHANLGWARSEETRQSATTWNLAAELSVNSALDLGAEVYGDDRNKPAVGVGARWHLNEQLSLNASYAVQAETPRIKLWTIGFKLAF